MSKVRQVVFDEKSKSGTGICYNKECTNKRENGNLMCEYCEHAMYFGHEIGDEKCRIGCIMWLEERQHKLDNGHAMGSRECRIDCYEFWRIREESIKRTTDLMLFGPKMIHGPNINMFASGTKRNEI